MDLLLFIVSALSFALAAGMAADLFIGWRRIPRLEDLPPIDPPDAPRVSIVVAARDEERRIEQGVGSMLAQEYPDLEVIVVDDRSTDGTPAILERMAANDDRLRVIRVDALPDGWLGKCHALHVGAGAATSEFLLFTDADVVMDRSVLARAMRHALDEEIDHLAIGPQPRMPTPLLRSFVVAFLVFYSAFARPWKAADPRSRHHVGIGAFNLVRRKVYESVGGFERIRLRPDDDHVLGRIIKKDRHRQVFVAGDPLLSVEWYFSFRELVPGLEKAAWAGLGYRWSMLLAATIGQLLIFVWPVAGLFIAAGDAFWLCAGGCVALLVMYADAARTIRASILGAPLFPLSALLLVRICWGSALKAVWRGGIEWRGTVYPLDEMRANRV